MIKINDMKDYINRLDVHIVSHGGVGTLNLIKWLFKNTTVKIFSNIEYNRLACHYPYKIIPDKKTLFIYGDVLTSIISQYNRNILHKNATKIHYKQNLNIYDLNHFLISYPDDPIGIKLMYDNYKNTRNTIFIKYPYDIQSLTSAFRIFGFDIDFSGFEIKPRKSKLKHISNYPRTLRNILLCYENYSIQPKNHKRILYFVLFFCFVILLLFVKYMNTIFFS